MARPRRWVEAMVASADRVQFATCRGLHEPPRLRLSRSLCAKCTNAGPIYLPSQHG